MKPSNPSRGGLVIGIPVAAVLISPLSAITQTWDNSSGNGNWFTSQNWDNDSLPASTIDAVFPSSPGGAVNLDFINPGGGPIIYPTANSLQLNGNYTLVGGNLTVTGGNVSVAAGFTSSLSATFFSSLNKSGVGTLILPGTCSGATVSGGTLRPTAAGAVGGSGSQVNVLNGATLELGTNLLFPSAISMANGATLRGLGNAVAQGTLTIDAAATSITFGTTNASDILQITDNSYELSGGSAATIVHVTGPGTVRPGTRNEFDGSWQIHDGTVDIRPAGAIGGAPSTSIIFGDNPSGSVTFDGGDFRVRSDSGPMNLTDSQANNVFLNEDTTFTSERLSAAAGVTHTVGSTTLGSHTFTIIPGPTVTSGKAGFEMTRLTLTGDPVFALPGTATANSDLIVDGIDGGATPRAITVTGDGNLTFDGSGTNMLADGSIITVTGGSNVLLNYPEIGPDPVTAVTMGQNPIGEADLTMTDGTLMLRGRGAASIYALPNHLTLGGNITVDPDRNASNNAEDIFRVASITLKPNTVMSVSGDSSFAIGSLAPVVLQGNATIQGFNSGTIADGVTNFYGGISGGPNSALTIGNTSRPINLTISASSTYGGGTTMNGGNVTLNAVNGFGTGQTTLNGGTLTVPVGGALNGTVLVNGGTLFAQGANVLATNSVVLNGGLLDFRDNSNSALGIGSLTISGTSSLNFARVTGGTPLLTTPVIDISGNTTLTVTNGSQVTNLISGFDLAGDLTLNASSTTRVTSITEDGVPRKLIKSGTGQLELEGASTYSGGTEVLAGVLYVENSAALGSGSLMIGATSGTANATARFAEGLTIPNDIMVRSGSSGVMTIDAEAGRLTWNGNVNLQKSVTLDNGSTTAADFSTFNGLISGVGDISKISGGEIVLANAANSFGSGTASSIGISAGSLTVAANGALGNPANGVNLTSSGILKINGTVGTSRIITVTGTSAAVNVTTGNTFTMNSPVAGTGTFGKGDAGTLEFAPGVDATARGSALTFVGGGVLRVQGLKNLGDASPISMDNGGTFEFARDPNTNFGHPVSLLGSGGIRVDRAIGGSGVSGRHTLGPIAVNTTSANSLTISGANGYGLTASSYTTAALSTVSNNAPGTFILGSLTGNPGTSTRTLTIGGSGDIQVTGAMTEGAGTGSYALVKHGAGRLTLGTSVGDFNRTLTVEDGTFDLNGLSYTSLGLVTMGGAASTLGAKIDTGAAGSLNLSAGLTFSATGTPAGSVVTGNVGIGTLPQTFSIANSNIPEALVDLTINGPITGSVGSSITKSGAGTLRLSGAGNTLPGLVSASAGILELGKSSGDAIGTGGLSTSGTSTVRLIASEQINNTAAISIGAADDSFLELGSFTETVGPLTITQADANDYSAVKTGPTGILVLSDNLSLNNNSNSSVTDGREVLITGSGGETTPASDGTLDLSGGNRTIQVSTTTVGTNEPRANATIETRIINGGIIKTGARTLHLTNPNNTFAGGLQIAQGFVRPGSLTSLGLGPVTFTNGPGIAAGIDYGSLTGTQTTPIATGSGTGDATYFYSAAAPSTLVLSGGAAMTQNIIFDVANGTTNPGDSAILDVTGILDDGAGTFGVTKIGNGTLKLANGNTYSGATTVQKGILSIAANSALGNGTSALTLDGGALQTANTWATARGLAFGASGGSVRVDAASALEFTGNVAWEAGTSAFFGAGATILSGTTSGTGGNLQLGAPTAFATVPFPTSYPLGHRLSLRGMTALPAGNLSITHDAVLELGNGNFTRLLGTGAGQVQFPTAVGGGWTAYGADRIVNLGGAGTPVTWGQTSPAFLYQNVTGDDYGDLILGSTTATHRVDFQNPLQLNNGQFTVFRQIEVPDGPAAVEARISGGISQSAAPGTTSTTLAFDVDGVLEITGLLSGSMDLEKTGTGTVVLSGTNTFTGYSDVYEGTLRIANDAAWGPSHSFFIETDATLDASAMTVPIDVPSSHFASIYGSLLGDLTVSGNLEGNGFVDGSVHAYAGAYVLPDYDGQLNVTGDFTLDPSSTIEFYLASTTPLLEYNQMRVGGTVTLGGNLLLGSDPVLAENDTFILLLNDGTDPIQGAFNGLPEGGVVLIGNGLALQVTYQANGDGGAVGNDVGFTVVPDTTSTDLALSVDAPLAVDLASSFTVTYTVTNQGLNDSSASSLEVELPANAPFNGSTPTGSVTDNLLTVPVPALTNGSSTTVILNFTAPPATGSIFVAPWIYNGAGDANDTNDYAPSMTAVLTGGVPVIHSFGTDLGNETFTMGMETISDVRYVFQNSIDLVNWGNLLEFLGNGELMEVQHPLHEPKEFFRFRILPYNNDGVGTPE